MRQRILLVGDYNRSDFLHVAKLLHQKAEFFFIEFVNCKYVKNRDCLAYGKVLFWKNYRDAYDLLDKIKPTKVIFYFIESYNHVALNVGCKVRNIPTFHLEHGLRFTPSFSRMVNRDMQPAKNINKRFKQLFRVFEIYDKYRNRKFFQNTVANSGNQERLFLQQYYAIRRENSIFDTFQKLRSPYRLPATYISFSPVIFNYHKEVENLPENYPVCYSGIPSFDVFYKWKHIDSIEENILFIDQPLSEQGLFGWTTNHKLLFLKELAISITSLGKKLYIKPHPLNEKSLYSEILSFEGVSIVDDKWEIVIPSISTVLGFYSTLLLPFMAMDHICCFTLEMHPKKIESGYSEFLISSGACHAAFSFKELLIKLTERKKWFLRQKDAKESFIRNWMFCFDGKSSERLEKILLEDEVA